MRIAMIVTTAVLALAGAAAPAFADCEDKSQQNAADEAGIHGEHDAASRCATQADVDRAEKKMEDAAVAAKRRSDSKATEGKAPDQPK